MASDTDGSPVFKPLRGPSDERNNNNNSYLTDGGYESSVQFQSDVESSMRPGGNNGSGYMSAGGGSLHGGRPKGVVINTPKGSQQHRHLPQHLRKNSLEVGSGTESATDYETEVEFNDEGNITEAEPADIPPLAPVVTSATTTTTTTAGGGGEVLVSPRRQDGSAPATARGPVRDPSAPQNRPSASTVSEISEDDAASRPSQMEEEVHRRRDDEEEEEEEVAPPPATRQTQEQSTARHRTGTANSELTQGSASQRPHTSTDDGYQAAGAARPNQLSGTYPPSHDDGRASTLDDGSQAQPEPLETTGLSPQRVLTEEEKAELDLRIRDEKIKALKEAKKRQRLEEEERRKIPKNWNQRSSKNWNDAFRHGGGLSAEDLIARNAKIAASQGRSGSVTSAMYAAQVNGSAAGSLMGGAAPSERSVGTRQRQKAYDDQLRERNKSTKDWMSRLERGEDNPVGQSYMLHQQQQQPRGGSRHVDPHQQRSSQYYMHPGNQQEDDEYYYNQQQQQDQSYRDEQHQGGEETLEAPEDQEVKEISSQKHQESNKKPRRQQNPTSQKEELEEYLDQQKEQHGKKVLSRNQSKSHRSRATERSATANTVGTDFESCISVSLDGSPINRDLGAPRHRGSEFDDDEEEEENPLNGEPDEDDDVDGEKGTAAQRKKKKGKGNHQQLDENGNPIDNDGDDLQEEEEEEEPYGGDEGDDDASPQRDQEEDGYEGEEGGYEQDHYYGGENIPDDFREGAQEADQQIPQGTDRLYLDFERRYQERKKREMEEKLKEERRRLARDRISQVHERLYREGMDQIHRHENAVEDNKRMKEMEEEYLMQHHLAAGAILHSADGHSIVDDVEFYDKMEIVRYDPQLEPEKAEAIGQRLYKRHTGGDSKAAEEERKRREYRIQKECTFQPSINSDRAPVTGDQDVGERLYKEGTKSKRIRDKKREETDLKMRQEIVAEMERNNHHLKERFRKDPELKERMLRDAIKSSDATSKKNAREKERNSSHRRAY